jgi:hypothetical protein
MTTPVASIISTAFSALAGKVRQARARGAQRIALRSLLEMDQYRLDDLGLNVRDVRAALAERGIHT